MKKVLITLLLLLLVGVLSWLNKPKIFPYYKQLTQERVGLTKDLQPQAQKDAKFVGSKKCKECHKEEYHEWNSSMHSRMIQNIKEDASVVKADFSQLPKDADFTLKDAIYTIGGKF